MPQRTAVVLFNLGGPDSLAAVQGFLYNLFADPDIIQLPAARFTQKIFAALVSRRRAPEARHGYAAIGGSSPLLANTERQAAALRALLAAQTAPDAYEVFICMRYWHPLTRQVVAQLKAGGFSRVVLLPLYPQYSRTTTGSSFNEFQRECARQHYAPRYRLIEHWYQDEGYLDAVTGDIRAAAAHLSDPDPARFQLLFSAHGLPQKLVDAGDPYEQHIRATYDAVCAQLQWPHTGLSYQSRVGPLAWLKPYTEDAIRAYGAAGIRQMLVYPIAFVSDHIETLYELGMTYAELARAVGIREYRVIPALNDHPKLIAALAQMTRRAAEAL